MKLNAASARLDKAGAPLRQNATNTPLIDTLSFGLTIDNQTTHSLINIKAAARQKSGSNRIRNTIRRNTSSCFQFKEQETIFLVLISPNPGPNGPNKL